jgi:enoyl-CoA hydratase
MDDFKTLTLTRDGAIATVRLNRPGMHNRFDDSLHTEITAAFAGLSADPDVRAIVLASTGPIFAGGADFEFTRSVHDDPVLAARVIEDGKQILRALLGVPQPIVVALHGDVAGIGCTIVLGCDMIVASRTARLLDPHVRLGLAAGDGACLMWPMSAGLLRAKRHLLTGDPLSAEDAHALGIVSDLVDSPDAALPAAIELAHRAAALPPLAVQGTKKVLNNLLSMRASEIVELGFMHSAATLRSDDLLEAISAFTEHRPGRYVGR